MKRPRPPGGACPRARAELPVIPPPTNSDSTALGRRALTLSREHAGDDTCGRVRAARNRGRLLASLPLRAPRCRRPPGPGRGVGSTPASDRGRVPFLDLLPGPREGRGRLEPELQVRWRGMRGGTQAQDGGDGIAPATTTDGTGHRSGHQRARGPLGRYRPRGLRRWRVGGSLPRRRWRYATAGWPVGLVRLEDLSRRPANHRGRAGRIVTCGGGRTGFHRP